MCDLPGTTAVYDCFEKNDSVCSRLYFKLLFLDTCNLQQILTNIIRIELL